MLELLHIENIAVIESADISYRPGFNALTGETTTIQLQLNHNGPFSMSLKLSVDLGKKHEGRYPRLRLPDEDRRRLRPPGTWLETVPRDL